MGSVEEGSISKGPEGGSGGTRWSFVASRGIFRIEVGSGPLNKGGEIAVKSISFTDADGFEYGRYGDRSTSDDEDEVTNWDRVYLRKRDKEHLTSIKGSYGSCAGMVVITSLTFITNQKQHGPFGKDSGREPFEFLMDGGIAIGFHGRSGGCLDALGVYVMPRSIEENISVGPWGLTSGQEWSFKINNGIKLIIVVNGEQIKSISIKDAGGQRSELLFGNNDPHPDDEENAIEIDTSSKYLMSVTGTYIPQEGIKSLSFVANNNTYGPFGRPSGTSFSVPIKDSVVVGFHGRGDNSLDALGYFVKPKSPETKITMGPWGGGGGYKWAFTPTDGVNEVIIRYEGAVFSVAFRDTSGFLSQIFGGGDPGEVVGTRKVIDIDWPSEYLTSISGSYGNYKDNFVITSLSFKTNWNSYGPYGRVYGTNFSSQTDKCVIVGFLGGAGYFLDAIGIYARPLHIMNKSSKVSGNGDEQEKCKNEEEKDDDELPGNSRERIASLQTGTKESPTETKITMGPWGGEGGYKWTFTPTDGVNEVIIRYEGAVFSVAFRDTSGFLSQIFGGGDPGEVVGTRKVIDIDWPSEYLTSISGSYGNYKDNFVITSLSFKTNWNSYGPYGRVYGTNFSSQTDNCVIVGFHGGAGYFLDAIGIYARPLHIMNKSSEVSGNGDEKDDDELPGNSRERTASLQTGTKESPTEASTVTRSNRLDRIKKIPACLQDCVMNLTQPAKKAMVKEEDNSNRV